MDTSKARKLMTPTCDDDDDDDGPSYDPVRLSRSRSPSSPGSPNMRRPKSYSHSRLEHSVEPPVDTKTLVKGALDELTNNAYLTKADISATFKEFRELLTHREQKLLADVDSTLEKKKRLLQTQLDYEETSGGGNANELVADPTMMLELEKNEIHDTLSTLGWVHGATTGILNSYSSIRK